jgi:hypothetical protein
VIGYVIIFNHVHCIINFPEHGFSLNTIISNAKRFMAYEIIKRLSANGEHELLDLLRRSRAASRKMKGQLHSAFRESFDGEYREMIAPKSFVLQRALIFV